MLIHYTWQIIPIFCPVCHQCQWGEADSQTPVGFSVNMSVWQEQRRSVEGNKYNLFNINGTFHQVERAHIGYESDLTQRQVSRFPMDLNAKSRSAFFDGLRTGCVIWAQRQYEQYRLNSTRRRQMRAQTRADPRDRRGDIWRLCAKFGVRAKSIALTGQRR